MIKNILLFILIVFTSIFAQGQITLTTTSSSNNWSPSVVTNSGNQLTWTAADNTAAGGTFTGQVENADDPTFDFGLNNGTPIEITITNTGNDFSGLTYLHFNGQSESGDISDIDISQATALDIFYIRYNSLSTLDISNNTALRFLDFRGDSQLNNQSLDISMNTNLISVTGDVSGINDIDLSNNSDITAVDLRAAKLTSVVMDKILIDLEANGLSGGTIKLASQRTEGNAEGKGDVLTYNSRTAYLALVARGWDIDVQEPPAEDIKTIVLHTTSSSNQWRLDRFYNYGATLLWEATGSFGTISKNQDNTEAPTFDFSGNINNDPIEVTITSHEAFDALTQINLNNEAFGTLQNSLITDIDISNAAKLGSFAPSYSSLTIIDISNNPDLYRVLIHGDVRQLNGQTLNTDSNPSVNHILIEKTGIVSVDFSNNPLLETVHLQDASLTSSVLDQVLITLDNNGLNNPPQPPDGPNIKLANQTTGDGLTSVSLAAYTNLINKGWTIDVGPPSGIAGVEINITGNNTSIPGDGSNTPNTIDNTDFGAVAENGTIVNTFTIHSLGDTDLNLTGAPDLVAITGSDAAAFSVTAVPTTPVVANGGDTIFEITFTAPVGGGVKHAVLTIENDDLDEGTYTFNIQATSLVNGPEIDISYNGNSISSNSSASITNGNDFGQVAVNSSLIRTFIITNLGDQDLTIDLSNSIEPDPPFTISNPPTSPIVSGGSITFDVTFSPTSVSGEGDIYFIDNNDSDEGLFRLRLKGEGVAASSGTIDVQGNGISILNGDSTPDMADDTDFGQVTNNTSKTNIFTIENTGATDLTITNIDFVIGGDSEFTFNNLPAPNTVIQAGGQPITFDVVFSPSTDGIYSAFVTIDNSDDTPFQFKIQGEGAGVVVSGDIMITQYYSGFNVTDKWIEIKNISGSDIPAGTYFLALYDQDDIPDIATQAPTASESIPFMATNDVLLFRPNSVPAKPSSTNIGTATQISTDVCGFDGDDVILISTTNDGTCYGHREDIIGDVPVVPSNPWGLNASFIKGGCATEQPHADFDIYDWIRIPLNEIDAADTNTNLALGTQFIGSTSFDGTSWSNGSPDRSRTVIFSNSFTHANQTIPACNLIVNSGVTAGFNSNGATNNSIILYGNLTTNGSLIIGDTESLVTLGDNPTLGTITKNERSNTLNNLHDNTYWSSPVLGSQISTIFSGVEASRIFEYQAGNPNPAYPVGVEYQYWWNKPSGSMNIGFGYAAEGPSAPVDSNDDYVTPFEHELTFVGIPFTGTKELDLFYSGSPDQGLENNNFNLIGNPYPTAINIDKFFDDNDNVREIALWTHSTAISGGEFTKADYVTYNRDGSTEPQGTVITNNIGSGQGFMARTTSYTDIRFLDSHKMIGVNDQFFKSSNSKTVLANNEFEGDKIWLEMIDNTGYRSNIMVGFSHKATDGLDSDYDSYGYVIERNIKLYSSIDQEMSKFVIQNLGSFSTDKKVSIGIDNKNIGNFKISIVGKLGELKSTEVYLVDHLLNITHDLKVSDYQFKQTATGSFPNRFTLQFAGQALDVDDEIFAKNELVISNDLDGFKIRSAQEVKDIKVYDLLGRMIIQKQPNKKSFNINSSNIKNGTVLVIKATLDNGSAVSKKTIKY